MLCDNYRLIISLFPNAAHYQGFGSSGSKGDPKEPACPLQELCRAHHHEDPRGPQRLPQGGEEHTHTHTFSSQQKAFSILWEALQLWPRDPSSLLSSPLLQPTPFI